MRSVGPKWLLLADIHFKHQDLDRIAQAAEWITSVAAQRRVHRVVVCGDLLTTRTSQSTHVLSACYRFLGSLVHDAQVSHVHVVLGNHDLAYRRDHLRATTALDALRLAAPAVQLHWDVGRHVWDGRRVLTLPFREDQSALTDAVAALDPEEAAQTVAFAHLAVHRAITQRHVVRPSADAASRQTGFVAYRGLTGPGCFSGLARTFTGHFHSHQTILQPGPSPAATTRSPGGRSDEGAAVDRLRGSVTYVGSPLQLTWADLWDEQRGVVLLDPETLDHELIVNPHAVGYITAGAEEVLGGRADPELLRGRHVMLLGDLTRFKYAAARDKLVSLGARSIRAWSPIAPRFQRAVVAQGLGASAPAGDCSMQTPNLDLENDMDGAGEEEQDASIGTSGGRTRARDPPQQEQQVDLREEVARYVDALDLEKPLEESRQVLVQVGQRLLEAAISEQAEVDSRALEGEGPKALDYKDILPPRDDEGTDPAPSRATPSPTRHALRSPNVFSAQPRSLTITNFLGVQSTIHLDFGTDIRRGLTFLVGENGSGKSTIVEAIVWCQFGECLRAGVGANDVVNDRAKKNCSVRMAFDNGYAITRFRRHKEHGNRVIVEKDGKVLPEFEKAKPQETQAAIDELLGISHETFVRTIVLGHESATSFLSSKTAQRRNLILSMLGLEVLDSCASTTRRLLRGLGEDMAQRASKLAGLEQTMEHVEGRIVELAKRKDRLETELKQIDLKRQTALRDIEKTAGPRNEQGDALTHSGRLDEQMSATQQRVEALLHCSRLADIREAFEEARSAVQTRRLAVLQHIAELEDRHSSLFSKKPVTDEEDLPTPKGRTSTMLRWLLDFLSRTHHALQPRDAVYGRQPSSAQQRSSPWMLGQNIAACSTRVLCTFLQRVLAVLGDLTGVHAQEESRARREEEMQAYLVSLRVVEGEITEQQRQLSQLQDVGTEQIITQKIASERDISEQDVRDSLDKVSADKAKTYPAQLNAALRSLADLEDQRKLHAARQARLAELQAATRVSAEKLAMIREVIDTETAALEKLRMECAALAKEMATLAAERDLLDFWASALAPKVRRVSSKSSSKSSTTSFYTFREFILEQSLAELNDAMTQILPIMFENSRHAAALTTGMLRSLFVGEEDHNNNNSKKKTESGGGGGGGGGQGLTGATAAALDSSLSVDARLSYGTRSGGERKRIDLALFFALLYVGHARSPHRAHYMLVDEVFDSLDAAGQAAVVRWCDFWAEARDGHIVVITHSENLVSQGAAGGGEESGAGVAVLSARMGADGVELEMDGKTSVGAVNTAT